MVARFSQLKETDINTDLTAFRESHAVTKVINNGHLKIQESIVQRYERMCILEPSTYKNDPSIPELIKQYQNIISGKTLDPEGRNIPSEELLGRNNPDYRKYLRNQAAAMKNNSLKDSSYSLSKERKRVNRIEKEEEARTMFHAYLLEQGIPIRVVSYGLTDGKLNTYDENDWKKFVKRIKEYLEISSITVVCNFVETFDDKDIVLNSDKFESFSVFYEYNVPVEILTEIIKDRISPEQAVRIASIREELNIDWDEAMTQILSEDIKEHEDDMLRRKYGWEG
jgi:hypothetical protein